MRTLSLQSFRKIAPDQRRNSFSGFVYSDDGKSVTVFEHGEEREYQEATEAFLSRAQKLKEDESFFNSEDQLENSIESDSLVSVLVSEAEKSIASEQIIFRDETEIFQTEKGKFYMAKDMLDWIKNYNGATPTAGELVDSIKYLLEFLKNS